MKNYIASSFSANIKVTFNFCNASLKNRIMKLGGFKIKTKLQRYLYVFADQTSTK